MTYKVLIISCYVAVLLTMLCLVASHQEQKEKQKKENKKDKAL